MPIDDSSPGWEAITATLESLYPGQEPRHVGYTPGLNLGSGLQGCSAYRAVDHWHFVTYGLTDMKATSTAAVLSHIAISNPLLITDPMR